MALRWLAVVCIGLTASSASFAQTHELRECGTSEEAASRCDDRCKKRNIDIAFVADKSSGRILTRYYQANGVTSQSVQEGCTIIDDKNWHCEAQWSSPPTIQNFSNDLIENHFVHKTETLRRMEIIPSTYVCAVPKKRFWPF
jgi:hypothetical protein